MYTELLKETLQLTFLVIFDFQSLWGKKEDNL